MSPDRTITLQFDESRLIVNKDVDIRNQLSAVVLGGDHMWLACDEGCRLERLTKSTDSTFAAHHVVGLETVLPLPAEKKEEADIEGLAIDEGWLWLVASHAVKRKKPKRSSASDIQDRLSETSRDGNRHLLARVPLAALAVRGMRVWVGLRGPVLRESRPRAARQRPPDPGWPDDGP
jgi:hypothetical protein